MSPGQYVIPLIFGICWSVSIQEIERIKAGGGAGEKVAVGYILIRRLNEYSISNDRTRQELNIFTFECNNSSSGSGVT